MAHNKGQSQNAIFLPKRSGIVTEISYTVSQLMFVLFDLRYAFEFIINASSEVSIRIIDTLLW